MAKRFYKQVTLQASEDAYAILLDGRVLKTPGKQALVIPRQFQAKLVAAEWQAQGEDIVPATMPCTRLLNVACELTPPRRPELIKEFSSYCSTDLLCFRSSTPQDLAKRQDDIWQPILDWVATNHGIALLVTTSLKTPAHPKNALQATSAYAQKCDDVDLTLLLHFTASFGSGVLALALLEGYMDVNSAFTASRLDEIYQNERWGADEEAEARAQNIGAELTALASLITE